jgi:hypothetical protein
MDSLPFVVVVVVVGVGGGEGVGDIFFRKLEKIIMIVVDRAERDSIM